MTTTESTRMINDDEPVRDYLPKFARITADNRDRVFRAIQEEIFALEQGNSTTKLDWDTLYRARELFPDLEGVVLETNGGSIYGIMFISDATENGTRSIEFAYPFYNGRPNAFYRRAIEYLYEEKYVIEPYKLTLHKSDHPVVPIYRHLKDAHNEAMLRLFGIIH